MWVAATSSQVDLESTMQPSPPEPCHVSGHAWDKQISMFWLHGRTSQQTNLSHLSLELTCCACLLFMADLSGPTYMALPAHSSGLLLLYGISYRPYAWTQMNSLRHTASHTRWDSETTAPYLPPFLLPLKTMVLPMLLAGARSFKHNWVSLGPSGWVPISSQDMPSLTCAYCCLWRLFGDHAI